MSDFDNNDDSTQDAQAELLKFMKQSGGDRAGRRSPRIEMIRGGQDAIADLMGALFGEAGTAAAKTASDRRNDSEADHPLLKALRSRKVAPAGPVPSSKAEVLKFLAGIEKFKIGDIVKLREDFKALDRWPTAGQECIVTQVLKTPYRAGGAGTVQIASQLDIALMFTMPSDSALDEAFGINEPGVATAEFLYDSRRFTKIGSIFD